jgi:hypothetical protein
MVRQEGRNPVLRVAKGIVYQSCDNGQGQSGIDERRVKKAGDGFGKFAGTFGVGHGEGEAASEAVARDPEFLEEV